VSRTPAWSELPAGELRRAEVDTPIGPLVLAADAWGLRRVLFPTDGEATPVPEATTVPGGTVGRDEVPLDPDYPILRTAARQLREYFAGERTTFELALHPIGSDFQRRTWKVLLDIPYGQTITYRQQADAIGQPGATQAVGAANGANPLPIIVPCHRVVGSDGSLVGFGGGVELKRRLLDAEQGTQRLF
jgi:methylated-DNA-[protein]-cysteine S-methyltransferase